MATNLASALKCLEVSGGVRIRTPARLHFGLLAPSGGDRKFGGAGCMLDSPSVVLDVQQQDEFSCSGELCSRLEEFAARWASVRGQELPGCQLSVASAPPQHSGLGVGTQLGLAVATGLDLMANRMIGNPAEMAAAVGRGARSAVGTYGFHFGGFIVEEGKCDDALAPLGCRLEMPPEWRFLLLKPSRQLGLAGNAEIQSFATLQAPPETRLAEIRSELTERLVPTLSAADFDAFSRSLYRYGYLSGLGFAPVQGGAYNGPEITSCIQFLRDAGVEGVGQSSWGPTVFALFPNQETAEAFAERLQQEHPRLCGGELVISAPNNQGAGVSSLG